jgi:RNA polymerase sigma factor (sigma-70 family)
MNKHFPLSKQYDESQEKAIIEEAQKGDRQAIERLVRQHQQFVYNVALKFVRDAGDAADLMQEVFLKVLTKLPQFCFKSSFRTWLYRIAMNHFLNSRRRKPEIRLHSFTDLGEMAESLPHEEELSEAEKVIHAEEIRDVRNKCMSSSLLCLDRQQRMVLILGFIFRVPSADAAPLLELTPENFRKQLQRAKEDLFRFMDDKCGLMNPDNPCRCHKKTKGFLKDGLLDPKKLKFDGEILKTIAAAVDQKNRALDDLMEGKYRRLFVQQPYAEPEERSALIESILSDPEIRAIYQLK